MINKKELLELINLGVERASNKLRDSKERGYVGGSALGGCQRALWFAFRKTDNGETFEPRMLRLFNRGHHEEDRIIELLRLAGFTVHQDDGKKQFTFKECDGHLSGSIDGVLVIGGHHLLLEMKTHNEKSFTKLKKDGIVKAHYKHYCQMQIYMRLSGLTAGLYVAVNKNTDEWYTEIVFHSKMITDQFLEKARYVIRTNEGVPGISTNPTWWECKFCNFRQRCHGTQMAPRKQCRSCIHASPGEEGQWDCTFNRPEVKQGKGFATSCHYWLPNPATMPRLNIKAVLDQDPKECVLILEGPNNHITITAPVTEKEVNDAIALLSDGSD